MAPVTPERLAEFRKLRVQKDRTKKAADDAKADFDRFQYDLFTDMQADGIESTKVDGVQYVRKATIYGNVQDMDAFTEWCSQDADRHDDYLKEAVQAARINEMVRDAINNNEELPPGLSFYTREYVAVTEPK